MTKRRLNNKLFKLASDGVIGGSFEDGVSHGKSSFLDKKEPVVIIEYVICRKSHPVLNFDIL